MVFNARPLAALVFLVPLFSGCMGGGSAENMAAPHWQAGYSFAYQEVGTYKESNAANGQTHSDNGTIGPINHIQEVLNTTLVAGKEPVWVLGTSDEDLSQTRAKTVPTPATTAAPASPGGNTGTVQMGVPAVAQKPQVDFEAVRQRDLESVPLFVKVKSSQCGASGCDAANVTLQFGPNPNETFLRFPLKTGKSWSYTVGEEGSSDSMEPGAGGVSISAKVGGGRTLDLPVGRVHAVRVDYTMRPLHLAEQIKKSRQEAEAQGVRVDKLQMDFSRRATVYYSDDYQTIVRSEYTNDYHLLARGVSKQGERFNVAQDARAEGHTDLLGARLVPRVERGPDYFGQLFMGKVKLNDPTGKSVQAVAYAVDLVANRTAINAAAGEAVTFTGRVLGLPSLPQGHSVKWHVEDATGTTVATGTGLTFTQTFKQPGEYTATLEALDEHGNATTADAAVVDANWIQNVPANCGPVALEPNLPGCRAVNVPVRPGIQSLTVQAITSGSALPGVSAAELRLVEGSKAKTYKDTTVTGGVYEIKIRDFLNAQVGPADWSLQLYQIRSVLQSATYKIDLEYGNPGNGALLYAGKGAESQPGSSILGGPLPSIPALG